jgi:hypothetical protein
METAPEVTQPRPLRVRFDWAIVCLALVAATSASLFLRGTVAGPGDERTVDLTLVAADKDRLNCALERSIGPFSCAFKAPKRPQAPAPEEKNRLSPYVSTDRTLYLGAGLFAEPSVAARTKADLEKPEKERQRFVAHCRVKLVERLESFQTRWSPRGRWEKSGPAWVIEPLECSVRDR